MNGGGGESGWIVRGNNVEGLLLAVCWFTWYLHVCMCADLTEATKTPELIPEFITMQFHKRVGWGGGELDSMSGPTSLH